MMRQEELDNGIKYITRLLDMLLLTTDNQYTKYNPAKPGLSINPSISFDADSDFVLEKSIGVILEKTDSNIYYNFIDNNTNTKLITHSAVEMVSAKYNMPNYHFTGTSSNFDTTGNMGSWNVDFMKGIYFDDSYYLKQKSNQLNALAINGKTDWTEQSTFEAINNAGMTPWEHFSEIWSIWKKLLTILMELIQVVSLILVNTMQTKSPNVKIQANHILMKKIVHAFQTVGIDPIVHYSLYGFLEDITPTILFWFLFIMSANLGFMAYVGVFVSAIILWFEHIVLF